MTTTDPGPTRPDFTARLDEIRARRRAADTAIVRCDTHPHAELVDGRCVDCTAERSATLARIEHQRRSADAAAQCDTRFPARFRDARVDHWAVAGWVEAYTADPTGAPSLLLLGPTGTGKTHQAYAAVRAAVTARPGTWQAGTAADLFAALRPRPGVDSEAELDRCRSAGLLLIDDLGLAKASEWTEEITYRLLNGRYEQMRPTVITTNLALAEFKVALGDRIASRLAETCTRVLLDGVDRRRSP